jgi:hypothetical protein
MEKKHNLLRRVEDALNSTNIQQLDDQKLQALQESIRREINSIPKLSYKQFRALDSKQQEEYTKLLERLASQSALLIKHKQMINNKPLAQFANNQNSHFTLMALQMAQERQEEKRRQQLEKIRQQIINHKKYTVSAPRLLHRLKCSRVQDQQHRELLDFVNSSPLLTKYSTLNTNTRKLIANMVVVLKDLKLIWMFITYAIEECLLYGT